MKSTVIIPNYNGMQYLQNCIQSLLAANGDFSILIVDNGSTDGSQDFIRENYPNIELICFTENTGFCHAVNVGVEKARTEYVILLNNDTQVDSNFVTALETALEKHAKRFSVSAKMINMYQQDILDGAGDYYCALGWAFAYGKDMPVASHCTRERKIFSACGGAAIYRKEIWNQLGGLDENHFAYLEDCDLGYRAQIYGYQNYFTPDAIVYHAGSGASGSRYNTFKIRLSSRNNIFLLYKNMPLLQMILNSPFLFAGFFVKYLFFLKKGFGSLYLKGLWEGIQKRPREKKVVFQWKHLGNYCRIQFFLWVNIIKRFTTGR